MNRTIRNIGLTVLLGCMVGIQSCTSWLDITPEAQVNDEKMFSTQQGFAFRYKKWLFIRITIFRKTYFILAKCQF